MSISQLAKQSNQNMLKTDLIQLKIKKCQTFNTTTNNNNTNII